MPIADVPSHFHGKAAKVDRSRQDLQPGVVHQPPADKRGQGGAIVGHGHHLGYREEVCHGDRDVALQLLLRQRLKQTGAHPSGRHDVDMLHRLELLARHDIADARMVGTDGAGEPFVHQVLDDEVVGRIDDTAQHERRRARHDACFHKIVAEGRQTKLYAGGDLLQARHDSGDEDELDIAVWRDREEPFGLCGVEGLLTEDRVVELGECLGDQR